MLMVQIIQNNIRLSKMILQVKVNSVQFSPSLNKTTREKSKYVIDIKQILDIRLNSRYTFK